MQTLILEKPWDKQIVVIGISCREKHRGQHAMTKKQGETTLSQCH